MRRAAYIATLVLLWITGMVMAVWWLDDPSRPSLAIVYGMGLAAFATVSIAEEIDEWISTSMPGLRRRLGSMRSG